MSETVQILPLSGNEERQWGCLFCHTNGFGTPAAYLFTSHYADCGLCEEHAQQAKEEILREVLKRE